MTLWLCIDCRCVFRDCSFVHKGLLVLPKCPHCGGDWVTENTGKTPGARSNTTG